MDLQKNFEGQSNRWQRRDSGIQQRQEIEDTNDMRTIEFHCSFEH